VCAPRGVLGRVGRVSARGGPVRRADQRAREADLILSTRPGGSRRAPGDVPRAPGDIPPAPGEHLRGPGDKERPAIPLSIASGSKTSTPGPAAEQLETASAGSATTDQITRLTGSPDPTSSPPTEQDIRRVIESVTDVTTAHDVAVPADAGAHLTQRRDASLMTLLAPARGREAHGSTLRPPQGGAECHSARGPVGAQPQASTQAMLCHPARGPPAARGPAARRAAPEHGSTGTGEHRGGHSRCGIGLALRVATARASTTGVTGGPCPKAAAPPPATRHASPPTR